MGSIFKLWHWSTLFLMVPVLGVGSFAWGAANGIWLPEDISADGHKIDHLFYFILWLTGAVFVATEVVLFWYMWRYDAARNPDPIRYTHGNHTLEVVWSALPALVLLFISIYQVNAWAEAKLPSGQPGVKPLALVTGRQFEWRIRYPGPDGDLYTKDDLFTVNDLHIPVDEKVMVIIQSEDVLHSFFLPNMRVKQDVVPGKKQLSWFQATKTGKYDLVCAELCGWGHYKMKGQLTVEPRSQFQQYLEDLRIEQNRATDPELPSQTDESDDE